MKNLKFFVFVVIIVSSISVGMAQKVAPQYYYGKLHVLGTDYFNFEEGEWMYCTFHYSWGTVTDNTPLQQAPNWYVFSDTDHSSGLLYITIEGWALDGGQGYSLAVRAYPQGGVLTVVAEKGWGSPK
ncbi:MAG: hypothetical protein K8R37_01815 [Bacteroidales bacterium]|nr:hypothetical protein [Bacteroidales bacterium]